MNLSGSAILNQLNAWRLRWKPKDPESAEILNRYFAQALSSVQGKEVINYLIETYYKPIEFIGTPSAIKLAERNGQQIMMVDILTRIDTGLHPMLYQESPSTEKPFDARE
jgi:hypothetical protein